MLLERSRKDVFTGPHVGRWSGGLPDGCRTRCLRTFILNNLVLVHCLSLASVVSTSSGTPRYVYN